MSVRIEREGPVLVVTLDRAEKRNALSRAMSDQLCAAWRQLAKDRSLRVAILTGAGHAAFCAGAQVLERREHGERAPGLGGLTRNLDPGKPVIAAINGPCLAGGLELALACDLRVAADHATFGLPEVRRGILPGAGGTQRLPRLVPLGLAMELLLTGEAIDAATALRAGLVNRVVPADRLLDEARELASRIARCAPLAVQAARAAALRGLHLPLAEALALEQAYAEPLRATDDAAEGVRAFFERRQPEFKGS